MSHRGDSGVPPKLDNDTACNAAPPQRVWRILFSYPRCTQKTGAPPVLTATQQANSQQYPADDDRGFAEKRRNEVRLLLGRLNMKRADVRHILGLFGCEIRNCYAGDAEQQDDRAHECQSPAHMCPRIGESR